ncbi:flagellar basal body L-ring protein FlgH [Vulcaniibacterium tengchongense]|uniref:Flagellar L-ring protein n=1 Tax=Vulcaniibacterium tengchongense TaxID=1273429 RepID=A0A3N4VM61_9GAMM|nr:flagellar basal body L-ring protein FlgH [Vulcaniibacterium tengchongense]RPE80879.1 flagellar L-ring protein precursor FlgH [Vulcaniibacterium tengchongense]
MSVSPPRPRNLPNPVRALGSAVRALASRRRASLRARNGAPWLAACLAPALAGCATVMGDVRPYAERPAPLPLPAAAAPQAASAGSIYPASRGLRLFEDDKAREVGDLVTIVLVESTNARTQARTSVSKDHGAELSAPTLAGLPVTYKGHPILQAGIDASREFEGAGDSTQSNRLSGSVTATVVQDLGNGTLLVRGEKRLRLNQGDELVQIQGIVRAADIGPDNRITSDRVGEARIVYGGRGTLARSNAMGWLGRFFNSAAFPY